MQTNPAINQQSESQPPTKRKHMSSTRFYVVPSQSITQQVRVGNKRKKLIIIVATFDGRSHLCVHCFELLEMRSERAFKEMFS